MQMKEKLTGINIKNLTIWTSMQTHSFIIQLNYLMNNEPDIDSEFSFCGLFISLYRKGKKNVGFLSALTFEIIQCDPDIL